MLIWCLYLTFKGASFKVQSYFSLLCQITKPLSSLTIWKLQKGDFVRPSEPWSAFTEAEDASTGGISVRNKIYGCAKSKI